MIQKTVYSLEEVKALVKEGYQLVSLSFWEHGQCGYSYHLEKHAE